MEGSKIQTPGRRRAVISSYLAAQAGRQAGAAQGEPHGASAGAAARKQPAQQPDAIRSVRSVRAPVVPQRVRVIGPACGQVRLDNLQRVAVGLRNADSGQRTNSDKPARYGQAHGGDARAERICVGAARRPRQCARSMRTYRGAVSGGCGCTRAGRRVRRWAGRRTTYSTTVPSCVASTHRVSSAWSAATCRLGGGAGRGEIDSVRRSGSVNDGAATSRSSKRIRQRDRRRARTKYRAEGSQRAKE